MTRSDPNPYSVTEGLRLLTEALSGCTAPVGRTTEAVWREATRRTAT